MYWKMCLQHRATCSWQNIKENVERPTGSQNSSLLHSDYRMGSGTGPRDDSAKIKPGALLASLHDGVLIDKCEAAFVRR